MSDNNIGMLKKHITLWKILSIALLFSLYLFYLLLKSCTNQDIDNHWVEQVRLDDGTVISIDREASYTYLPKVLLAESSGLTNIKLSINIPTTIFASAPPTWEFNAIPLLLDYDKQKNTWFIVATGMYCNSWESAGYPPYRQWQYELKDNKWIVVPLDQKLLGRTTNIYLDFMGYDNELPKLVTLDYKDQYFKTIPSYSSRKYIKLEKTNCSD